MPTFVTRKAIAPAVTIIVTAAMLAAVTATDAQATPRFKPGLPVDLGPQASGPAWPGAAPLPTSGSSISQTAPASPLTAMTSPTTITLGPPAPAPRLTSEATTAAVTPAAAVAAALGTGQWQSIGSTGVKLAPVATPARSALSAAPTGAASSARGPVTVSMLTPDAAVAVGLSRTMPVFRVRSDGSTSQPGAVAVAVPTAALAAAVGADYASRVRWVQWTEPSTGAKVDLRAAQPVGSLLTDGGRTSVLTPTTNTTTRSTLVAASAGSPNSASGTGDLSASPIKPSSQWNVAAQTGSFSWSEPLRVPPAATGPTPSLALSYSGNTIDGETGSTNNQNAPGIGDGWDLSGGGAINRSFATCAFDTPTGVQKPSTATDDTGDECWRTDNATLTLNGQSNVLVKGADGTWRLSGDDGSRVDHLTGAANGTSGSDYWRITTRDGTQYFFGLNQLPGATSGAPTTNSVFTVPVYGNDSTEPCHAAAFKDSSCNQAWQWNLDYVLDVHQQSEAFYYTQEPDSYTANSGPQSTGTAGTNPTQLRPYVRAGNLDHIDYDMHAGSETTSAAPDQVKIDHDIRCMATDDAGNAVDCTNHANWQDTPFDQDCLHTPANCATKTSPTFFSETRVTDVHTQVRNGSTYNEVDRWTLTQTFPSPGDGTTASLWLRRITHTGSVGGTVTLPSTAFGGAQIANRMKTDTTSGLAAQIKWRINLIQNESGATTAVSYLPPSAPGGCTSTITSQAPSSNGTRCYPQWWTPPVTDGVTSQPQLDWFVQHPVTSVITTPTTGGASAAQDQTYYTYSSPAWTYDTSPLVPDAKRTWSNFTGYSTVRVDHGDPNTPSTQESTQYRFFRGLNGDRATLNGGTKSVTVTASDGTAIPDERWWAGRTLEATTTNGVGGATVTNTVTVPYGVQTGTDGTHVSEYTDDSTVTTRTTLATGGPRTGVTTTTHDGLGRPTTTDENPDTGNTALERCSLTSYADNTDAMLLSLPRESQTVAGACAGATAPATTPPAATLSDTRTSYDGGAFTATPSRGDATTSSTLMSLTPSAHWVNATTGYDILGRPISVTAPLKPAATTTYTPAASATAPTGPVTGVAVTNAMGWTSSTTYNPAWGSATAQTDPNGNTTSATYDAIGRVTAVWRPNHPQTSNPTTPSAKYGYTVSQTQPTTVATSTLDANGVYQTSYTLYDGMSRPVQTQAPSEAAGSVVTDTFYDAAGRVITVDGAYASSNTPSTTLHLPPQPQNLPNQTRTVWDGAGRKVSDAFWSNNTQRWTTSYAYGGDRVNVTPPSGATPTTTVTDARGQTTSLLQYHGTTPAGAADTTSYTYTAAGKLQTMTDPAGHQWGWTYDLLGHTTVAVDPDTGTTSSSYDDAGRLITTTDARSQQLSYTYDNADRKKSQYAGTVSSGTQLAAWTYDTKLDGSALPNGIGRPYTSTRYVNGAAYTEKLLGYDALGNPTTSSYILPAAAGKLAGTYTTKQTYAVDGSPLTVTDPAEGSLPAETMTAAYDGHGLLAQLGNGTDYYGYTTTYNGLNQLAGTTAGSNIEVSSSRIYDVGTNRLTGSSYEEIGTSSFEVANDIYTYDPAGNVTSQTELAHNTAPDEQCFTLDYLQRLTRAFTPTRTTNPDGDCGTAPTATTLGGPAPYWQDYTYDTVGDRKSITRHGTSSAASTTSTSYGYPSGASAIQPHAFTNTTTTTTTAAGNTTTAPATAYSYDPVGNAVVRPNQKLTWDATGKLSSVQVGTSTANAQTDTYDADGNLLLRTDPTTGTTAYLGDTELHLAPGATTPTAVRTYSFLGQVVAERVSKADGSSTLTWLFGDEHSTQTAAVDDQTGAVTHRYTDPFGAPRGTVVPWQSDHGFLNAPTSAFDTLTHLGAREYDPLTGQFISVDPVLDRGNPQQNLGYSYAHNNPITASDPTGLRPAGDVGDVDAGDWGTTTKPIQTGYKNEEAVRAKPAPRPPGQTRSQQQQAVCEYEQNCTIPGTSIVNPQQVWLAPDGALTPNDDLKQLLCGLSQVANSASDSCHAGNPYNILGTVLGFVVVSVVTVGAGDVAEGGLAVADAADATEGAVDAADAADTGAGDLAGATCGGESFTPDTNVVMSDGSTKPLDEVKVGEKVQATDPKTGKTSAQTVTTLWVNHDTDLMDVTISVGGRTSTIQATQHHLFWDATRKAWVEADQLVAGDLLRTGDGSLATVGGTVVVPGGADMWDLTVDNDHDFYVVTATTSILVHNCPVDPRDIHGADRVSSRGIDVQHVVENGDLYYQDDGQLVRVLDNGNGTSDVVIRDASNPSGQPTSANRVPNSYVQRKINSGAWG